MGMNLCHKPVFSSRMRSFMRARRTSRTTSAWVIPQRVTPMQCWKFCVDLTFGPIAEEVGKDKMIVRPGYQADDRSSPHQAHFSPLHRCDSLRDDQSARRRGRPPSSRETLCYSKTWVWDPGTFSNASFNILNVFAGVFFLFFSRFRCMTKSDGVKWHEIRCQTLPHIEVK